MSSTGSPCRRISTAVNPVYGHWLVDALFLHLFLQLISATRNALMYRVISSATPRLHAVLLMYDGLRPRARFPRRAATDERKAQDAGRRPFEHSIKLDLACRPD